MSQRLVDLPVNASAQASIGGFCNVEDWMDEEDTMGNVQARGVGEQVTVEFASSGTYASPNGWTPPINLPENADGNISAELLGELCDTGIQNAKSDLVIVCRITGNKPTPDFNAKIEGSYGEDWASHD